MEIIDAPILSRDLRTLIDVYRRVRHVKLFEVIREKLIEEVKDYWDIVYQKDELPTEEESELYKIRSSEAQMKYAARINTSVNNAHLLLAYEDYRMREMAIRLAHLKVNKMKGMCGPNGLYYVDKNSNPIIPKNPRR